MKIYDISQEVFNCAVYPGDRAAASEVPAGHRPDPDHADRIPGKT